MLFSVTNISGIIGLIIIFILAGIFRDRFEWLIGAMVLLVIIIIRNISGEVIRKVEILLSVCIFLIVLLTLLFLIN